MPTLTRTVATSLIIIAAASCSRPNAPSSNTVTESGPPAPPVQAPPPKQTSVPTIAELPNGTSQVGGLTFKATSDAAISLISTSSDGSSHVQGSIPIEIANNTNDIVSIILSGNGVTVSLNNGKTIDNANIKGLKVCTNTIVQCSIGQKGDFVQISPAQPNGSGSGEPISVIVPFDFWTQAAETPSLRNITSANVVGTLFLTDVTGPHQESLHINGIALKNYTQGQ